jgi:CSLREA domain-containing protein
VEGGRAAMLALGIVILALFAGGARPDPASAVPANDDLKAALDVQLQPYTNYQDNLGQRIKWARPPHMGGCSGLSPSPTTGATVWYKTRGNGTTMLADTIGSATNTVVAVYSTTNPTPGYGDLTLVGCSGDEFLSPNSGVSFFADGLKQYFFQVGGDSGATGNLIFNLGVGPGSLGAAFSVKSTADAPDMAPGDGFCNSTVGPCTLRAAIQESNTLFGPQFIRFSISGPPIIAITMGPLPAITDSVI